MNYCISFLVVPFVIMIVYQVDILITSCNYHIYHWEILDYPLKIVIKILL